MAEMSEKQSAENDAGRVNPFLRFDSMTWPDPSDPNETAWRLIYGQPSKEDLAFAASVMSAYAHLIYLPQRERNQRVSQIRANVLVGWCREETCRHRHWRSGSMPTHRRGADCPIPPAETTEESR